MGGQGDSPFSVGRACGSWMPLVEAAAAGAAGGLASDIYHDLKDASKAVVNKLRKEHDEDEDDTAGGRISGSHPTPAPPGPALGKHRAR